MTKKPTPKKYEDLLPRTALIQIDEPSPFGVVKILKFNDIYLELFQNNISHQSTMLNQALPQLKAKSAKIVFH